MENQQQNNWTQQADPDDPNVREGKSSLDQINQDNAKREEGDWSNAEKRGTGDYGSEGGRSDEGVTGSETAISRPPAGIQEDRSADNDNGNVGRTGGVEDLEKQQRENDQWDTQHPGELPI